MSGSSATREVRLEETALWESSRQTMIIDDDRRSSELLINVMLLTLPTMFLFPSHEIVHDR